MKLEPVAAPAIDPSQSALARFLLIQRPRLRIAFLCYALALFTATHWPALELHVPYIQRPDLIIHFGCFGTWFACFWLAAVIGPPLQLHSIGISILVSVAYAGVDEGLQGLPFVRRHCAWDDFFANCGGILLAALMAFSITLLCHRSRRERP